MKQPIKSVLLMTVLLMMSANGSEAWCNKPRETNGAAANTRYELPVVEETAPAFTFEAPDPKRQLRQVDPQVDPNGKTVYQVAISTGLSPQQVDDVQRAIFGMIDEKMCQAGDALVIWDGNARRVTEIHNTGRRTDCSAVGLKFKIAENKRQIAALNHFLNEVRAQDLPGTAALNVTHLAHHLGQELHEYGNYPNRVLIFIGSALHLAGEGEPTLDASYPSVGMLRAPLSAYDTSDKAFYLGNSSVHVIHLNRFQSRAHERGIRNFVSAFFLSQGAPLLTFSSDTEIKDRVLKPDLPVIPAYLDDVQPGYVVLNAVGDIFAAQAGSTLPTRLERGSLRLGLQFPAALDLDLHVGLIGQPERVSFRKPQTAWATLRKQPGSDFEEVFLTEQIRPQDVELYVNFFAGVAPPAGATATLKVVFAGQLYSKEIAFPAAQQGNRGATDSQLHWQRVDLQELLTKR